MKTFTHPIDFIPTKESTATTVPTQFNVTAESENATTELASNLDKPAQEFAALKKEMFQLRAENVALKRIVSRLSKT